MRRHSERRVVQRCKLWRGVGGCSVVMVVRMGWLSSSVVALVGGCDIFFLRYVNSVKLSKMGLSHCVSSVGQCQ